MGMDFVELQAGDKRGIERMAQLASGIWREHYTPILGVEQLDYMIPRFQSAEAVAEQLEQGYQYRFCCVDGEPVGYMAFYPHEDHMYLSKLYLRKDARGHGYSHAMLDHVRDAALEAGLCAIELNVNRFNAGSIAAYDALGFKRVRQEKIDIGGGFFMDDYVYRIDCQGGGDA